MLAAGAVSTATGGAALATGVGSAGVAGKVLTCTGDAAVDSRLNPGVDPP